MLYWRCEQGPGWQIDKANLSKLFRILANRSENFQEENETREIDGNKIQPETSLEDQESTTTQWLKSGRQTPPLQAPTPCTDFPAAGAASTETTKPEYHIN